MSRPRILLIAATVVFVGWLAWLAVAMAQKGKSPVVSRAQLTASTHLIVVDVQVGDDGLPKPLAKVIRVVRGEGVEKDSVIEVINLPSAMPPGASGFPGPGEYLLPVVGDGKTFRIAGMPRSPGYEPTSPVRPTIYHWGPDTEAQLRGLKLVP